MLLAAEGCAAPPCPPTHLADAGEHVPPELQVAVDLGLHAAHTHMALVDAQGARPAGHREQGG